MRKQTKLAVLVSAAALLSAGAAMTAFAGWQQEEDGRWYYLDRDGYMVENTWKPSNGQMFWLGEDGYMETDFLVEDDDGNYYYVDGSGAMVTKQWRAIDNEDYYDTGDESEDEYHWYYFQGSGKAYKAPDTAASNENKIVWRTINGKRYTFDDEGHMLHGWIDADTGEMLTDDDAYREAEYYCGSLEDGARRTSAWERLDVSDDGPGVGDNEQDPNDDGCAWFWFGADGKKVAAEAPDETVSKTINGQKYRFDQDGLMVSGWVDLATSASTSNGFYRTDEQGYMKKGWFQAVPSEVMDSSAYNDDSVKWFYADNDGKLKVSEIFSSNGKKYAFNEKGEMLSGLQALYIDANNHVTVLKKSATNGLKPGTSAVKLDTVDKIDAVGKDLAAFDYKAGATYEGFENYKVYYFGSGSDGALKTGNVTLDVDGDTYQFLFDKTSNEGNFKGAGHEGIYESKSIYSNGRKIKADSDSRYEIVKITYSGKKISKIEVMSFREYMNLQDGDKSSTDTRKYYVVNASGSIQKSAKRKDADSLTATTNSSGKLDGGNTYKVEDENDD